MPNAGSRGDPIREAPNRFNLLSQGSKSRSLLRRIAKSRRCDMAPKPKSDDLYVWKSLNYLV